jgi:hypothetical protein
MSALNGASSGISRIVFAAFTSSSGKPVLRAKYVWSLKPALTPSVGRGGRPNTLSVSMIFSEVNLSGCSEYYIEFINVIFSNYEISIFLSLLFTDYFIYFLLIIYLLSASTVIFYKPVNRFANSFPYISKFKISN